MEKCDTFLVWVLGLLEELLELQAGAFFVMDAVELRTTSKIERRGKNQPIMFL